MRLWPIGLAVVVAFAGGVLVHRGCQPEAEGIEQRADWLVTDSLPAWQRQDRLDSIATDSLIRVAEVVRDSARMEKVKGLRFRAERDSLRLVSAATQDALDSTALAAPPEAIIDHPGVIFWRALYSREHQLAADFRLEADLARQGDTNFLGSITRLENAAAVDAKTIRRVRSDLAKAKDQRDRALATLDTLRRSRDCSGPLGIPCPELGIGLGVTYGAGSSVTRPGLQQQVTVGATIGVYFPIKQIRLGKRS